MKPTNNDVLTLNMKGQGLTSVNTTLDL